MIKKIFYIFIYFILFYNISYGEETSCKYSGEIQQCLNSQDNPRTINNFICIQGTRENIIYQIILDEEFKKIDKKIEDYLDRLDKAKGYYFGLNKKEPFTNAINDIEYYLGVGGIFEKQYKKLCDGIILGQAINCFGGKTSNVEASNYLENSGLSSKCVLMYKVSLENYKNTAYQILKNNKFKIEKDNNKSFTQKLRKNFDNLLDLIMVNIGYLERIGAKWQSKTKNPN